MTYHGYFHSITMGTKYHTWAKGSQESSALLPDVCDRLIWKNRKCYFIIMIVWYLGRYHGDKLHAIERVKYFSSLHKSITRYGRRPVLYVQKLYWRRTRSRAICTTDNFDTDEVQSHLYNWKIDTDEVQSHLYTWLRRDLINEVECEHKMNASRHYLPIATMTNKY